MTPVRRGAFKQVSADPSIIIAHTVYDIRWVHFINPALRRLAVQVVNFAGGFIKDITISVEGEIISAHKLLLSFVLGLGLGL